MSEAMLWTLMAVVGLGTLAFRASFVALAAGMRLPGPVERGLRYVPAAVLAAIVVPAIFGGGLEGAAGFDGARAVAGLGAALVAWRTRDMLATLGAGMALLWIVQALTAG